MKFWYNPPVIAKKIFSDFQWESKIDKILFTFDDGPTIENTERILKELNHQKIKAIFFCVGNNIKNNPSLGNEILGEGHSIGNHTFNHQILTKTTQSIANVEIDSVNHLLKEQHNYDVKYFRPPHGRFDFSTSKTLKKRNLQNIMWSLLTYDYQNDLNLVKFAVTKYLKQNSIIVLHDSMKSKDIILDSIKLILDQASKKNFKIGEPVECLK